MNVKEIEVYQIDSAVAIPHGRQPLPLKQLEVGESFVFPIEKRNSVASIASVLKRETGKVFIVRKQDGETCRIWRTA